MKIFKSVFVFIFLAIMVLIFFERNRIYDFVKLYNYSAPSEVSALAEQDSMTEYAKHLLYVNHPSLETDVKTFNNQCNKTEKTIVLGCYHPTEAGVYVFKVSDSRLYGVQQVTIAHEMLHAAYDRLSKKDKKDIDNMIESYYSKNLTDDRIKQTIELYRQTEPNDVTNEMHSIFGSEIENLPANLENYYSKYFKDRKAVARFASAYQGEFTSRESKIREDDSKLASLKNTIDSEENSLSDQLSQIQSDKTRLDNLRSSSRISEYNSLVSPFNAEVERYNSGISKLKSNINTYNSLVASRNSIAADLASLSQAIDTRLSAQ